MDEWFVKFLSRSADAREVYSSRYKKVKEISDAIEAMERPQSAALPVTPSETQSQAGKVVPQQAESTSAPGAKVEAPGGSSEIIGMGGAVPSEFEPPRGTPTSNKNAVVDRERIERGLEPMMTPLRQTFGDAWSRAMAKIDQDPGWQDRLVVELAEKPRAIEPYENAALLHRRVDLRNEYEKAARDAARAYDDGRIEDVAVANERTAHWGAKLGELEAVTKTVGTESGRSLVARKMMMNEDFSLASLELEKRAANDWRPLTNNERAELVRIADEYKRTNEELNRKIVERDQKLAEVEAARVLAELKAQQAKSSSVSDYVLKTAEKWVARWDKAADKARKELAGKFLSPTPEDLYNLALIARADIARIGLDLAKWTAKMVEEFGEGVRPYVNEAFEKGKQMIDEMIAKTSASTDKKERLKETVTKQADTVQSLQSKLADKIAKDGIQKIGPLARKLARLFVEQGSKTVDDLVDKVHDVISALEPSITKRQVMDAISGYGEFKQLTKDEISIQLRDLKGQMQQLAKLGDMMSGEAPRKTGVERRTPSDTERRLIAEVNEAKKTFEYQTTDPETQLKSAIDTVKTRITNQVADLEDKLKRKDFSVKKRTPMPSNDDVMRLRFKLEMVKRKWYEGLIADRMAKRTPAQKFLGGLVETANLARAIQTSFDMSAVLRQGKFLTLTRPMRAAKSFGPMFRAAATEEGAFAIHHALLERPNYVLYRQAKLFLAEHNQGLTQMEEAYMSRWAQKVPGVSHSQRAYVAFLNQLRADSFDAMVQTLGRDRKVTLDEAKVIANYINVVTGRGTFGMKEGAAVGLSTAFFAPRFVMSRFQLLFGHPMWYGAFSGRVPFRSTLRARLMIANEYARILAGVALIYALGRAAGADIETDPRSSDFGKLRFGNTRIDPLAGLQQVTVLLSRLGSGETKNLRGQIKAIRGEQMKYGDANAFDIATRFLRTKLAPLPASLMDVASGKDVVGEPVTLKSEALDLVTPLTLNDIYRNMIANGVPAGTALMILSFFGENIQTYDENPKR